MSDGWTKWWRGRGDDRLSLLLWAVWNPIGPVPLDEYENFTGRVVAVLQRAREADQRLLPSSAMVDDATQRRRNAQWAASVEALASLLGELRQRQMELPPNAEADRHAAETLVDWYDWEMDALDE